MRAIIIILSALGAAILVTSFLKSWQPVLRKETAFRQMMFKQITFSSSCCDSGFCGWGNLAGSGQCAARQQLFTGTDPEWCRYQRCI